MNYSVLIAAISLVISLFLSCLEIKRRWHKIHFAITYVDKISGKGNEVFVVFYLSFVNRSTIPKIIFRLDSELLENYQVSEVHGEPDSELSTRIFQAFGNVNRLAKARFDDIASFPLDIEPLHSRTVLLPVIISPVQPLRSDNSSMKTIGHFVAYDHRNRIMAKAAIKIPV